MVLTKDEEETLQSLLTILQGGFRSLQRHGGSRDLWGDCQEGRERGGGQDDGGGDHDDHDGDGDDHNGDGDDHGGDGDGLNQVVIGKQYQNHNSRPGPVYAGGGYTPINTVDCTTLDFH